jgi:hypothetical protein
LLLAAILLSCVVLESCKSCRDRFVVEEEARWVARYLSTADGDFRQATSLLRSDNRIDPSSLKQWNDGTGLSVDGLPEYGADAQIAAVRSKPQGNRVLIILDDLTIHWVSKECIRESNLEGN